LKKKKSKIQNIYLSRFWVAQLGLLGIQLSPEDVGNTAPPVGFDVPPPISQGIQLVVIKDL
jgi:hypothetical protein